VTVGITILGSEYIVMQSVPNQKAESALTQFCLETIPEQSLFEVGDGGQQEDEQNRPDEAADDGECWGRGQQGFAHLHAAEQQDRDNRRHEERRAFVQNRHRRL
jgi:hypothetical protein